MTGRHLLVFSHLRWDFVYQRPQHLLSRLARHYPVLFVEEPVYDVTAPAHLEVAQPCEGVVLLRPHTPVAAGGFHDDQLSVLAPLLQHHLAEHAVDDLIAWFYTPMALPLITGLAVHAVVYDCMDELAAFKGAPKQMRQRESALLKQADLVLTGGPSLYEAKRALNPHVHCLPSAVDAPHFAPRRAALSDAAHRAQRHLPPPRLGYYGVIDERLDLPLVTALADADPRWQVVMAGPVVKIDPAALPQRPNLHWLGRQAYEDLPALVAGWDVCLLPFALNQATRYISPTKTLEYMAAEKPVVSTAIQDVIGMYGHAVQIGHDRQAFIAACAAALDETPSQRTERIAQMWGCVMRMSWDDTAATVLQLLDDAVGARRGRVEPSAAPDEQQPLDVPLDAAAAVALPVPTALAAQPAVDAQPVLPAVAGAR
ncbi:glycosyltransferase [Caldimonas brevitalea]|uniref:Glycosyltransferase n=1 Tax=Caldimonas brevitalea TaxID=413882 RepID=A0A0G3BT38_9BURK|nr:glycosyltransferase [Caldimonas brevitalea]AKJ30536.1 glycosyltransferase [Caldimonas brevitalea]